MGVYSVRGVCEMLERRVESGWQRVVARGERDVLRAEA